MYEDDDDVPGIQFLQHGGAAVGGTDGITHERIACFMCQSRGHYSDARPDTVIVPEPVVVIPAVQLFQVEIEEAIEVDDASEHNQTKSTASFHRHGSYWTANQRCQYLETRSI